MKKNIILILMAMLAFSSCKTRENIVYFQDATPNESAVVPSFSTLKLAPGDKVSIIVTSAATPELAERYNLKAGSNYSSNANVENLRYTIDENGNIDMLGLGRFQISGLTRAEAAAKIQTAFRNGILNDAVVTIASYNQYVTILGDVARPGNIGISRDNMTILEAIGMAGDLNITGKRNAIKVIRQEGNENKTYFVDLRSKDLFNSPVYYLRQNDIIYVEPNKVKMGQSTNNDNSFRSIGTWLSVSSLLLSIAILIFN